MCWLYCHSHSVSSIDSWISGIAKSLSNAQWPPLPRHSFYADHRKGLKSIFGPVDGVVPSPPIDEDDLRALRRSLQPGVHAQDSFWFCSLIGFQALLRAGEIVAGRLRLADIQETKDGLTITVPFSKTQPFPVRLAVARRDDELCPVRAYYNLVLSLPASAHGKVYSKSYNAFNSEFKRRFAYAGVTTKGLSTHAMRRGGATALFTAGVPTLAIMAHGRWTSDAWRKYVDFGSVQRLLPTQTLHRAGRASRASSFLG